MNRSNLTAAGNQCFRRQSSAAVPPRRWCDALAYLVGRPRTQFLAVVQGTQHEQLFRFAKPSQSRWILLQIGKTERGDDEELTCDRGMSQG